MGFPPQQGLPRAMYHPQPGLGMQQQQQQQFVQGMHHMQQGAMAAAHHMQAAGGAGAMAQHHAAHQQHLLQQQHQHQQPATSAALAASQQQGVLMNILEPDPPTPSPSQALTPPVAGAAQLAGGAAGAAAGGAGSGQPPPKPKPKLAKRRKGEADITSTSYAEWKEQQEKKRRVDETEGGRKAGDDGAGGPYCLLGGDSATPATACFGSWQQGLQRQQHNEALQTEVVHLWVVASAGDVPTEHAHVPCPYRSTHVHRSAVQPDGCADHGVISVHQYPAWHAVAPTAMHTHLQWYGCTPPPPPADASPCADAAAEEATALRLPGARRPRARGPARDANELLPQAELERLMAELGIAMVGGWPAAMGRHMALGRPPPRALCIRGWSAWHCCTTTRTLS
jgi:hypothetical protein